MPSLMWVVAFGGLFLLSVIQFCVVFYLAYHVGVLYTRIGSSGTRMTKRGPKIGKVAPDFVAESIEGAEVKRSINDGRRLMLVFWSPGCSLCESLEPGFRAVTLRESNRIRFVVVFRSQNPDAGRALAFRLSVQTVPIVNSPHLFDLYGVIGTPHAVLLDPDGVVITKGTVRDSSHLESLIEDASPSADSKPPRATLLTRLLRS